MKPLALYQIILVGIGFYFIIDRVMKFHRKQVSQSPIKLVVIVGIWVTIIVSVLFPQFLSNLLSKLGLHETTQTLFFAAIIVIFLMLLRFLSIIEQLERNITTLVRSEALSRFEYQLKRKKTKKK